MKKNTPVITFVLLLSSILLIPGCVNYRYAFFSVAGVNVQDLENEKNIVSTLSVEIPFEDAFKEVLSIAEKEKLTIYQKNKERKYIVLMGFEGQIYTTRVGVFFHEKNGSTDIFLRSLSKAALERSENMIFPGLKDYSL